MTKVIEFPIASLSEKDKKILRLDTYIRSNIIELSNLRKELIALGNEFRKLKEQLELKVIKNEHSARKK